MKSPSLSWVYKMVHIIINALLKRAHMNNFGEKVNFIWSIAELLGDAFKRSKYQDVILPLTVLSRIDCVLEPTKQQDVHLFGQEVNPETFAMCKYTFQ